MSALTVLNAILTKLQNNSDLENAFSSSLTGVASSDETIVTGIGTSFTSEVSVNDYIGNITSGYKKVVSITDDTHLVVNSSFNPDLNESIIKKIEIKPGLNDNENISETGKVLRLIYVGSSDIESNIAKGMGLIDSVTKVYVAYGFVIVIIFYEPDEILAEERKSIYERLIKNAIDSDMTFGGVCLGITEMGKFMFSTHPEARIIYGTMPLTCYRGEQRGQR